MTCVWYDSEMNQANPIAVPFAVPTVEEVDIAAVTDAMRSGWLTRGPKVGDFERTFADYCGASHALATASCTAALHLALAAHDVGEGDEVIVSTMTFVSAANAIAHLGAQPVFVDVEPDTLNPNPRAIERAITPFTRAIMPVHYGGHPCDLDAIADVAGDIFVVEDAAHAVGARYRGRPIGTHSSVTCFSFYSTKNMTTFEGGMATCGDEELDDRMRRLSLHGMDSGAWARYGPKGSAFYEVQDAGFKYNMTDPQAALGLAQLQRLDAWNERRAEIAARYQRGFAGEEAIELPAVRDGVSPVWHLFPVRLVLEQLDCERDALLVELREAGIGTSVHFIPVHTQPFFQRTFGTMWGQCPVAEAAFRRLISLPIYPSLTDAQVDRVIDAVVERLERHRR